MRLIGMRFVPVLVLIACNAEPTVPKQPPGFVYIEDRDELTFWPPTSLRLVRAGKQCASELSSGHGNMWTGPDVEAALADPEVRAAVSRGTSSFSAAPDMDHTIHAGTVRIGKGAIEWSKQCGSCKPEPPGVRHLHTVLVGVMRNRRLLCEEAADR